MVTKDTREATKIITTTYGLIRKRLPTHDSGLIYYGPENRINREKEEDQHVTSTTDGDNEKTAFQNWLEAIAKNNTCSLAQMDHICSDEEMRRELYEGACTVSTPVINGFKSTIDSANRIEDSERVAKKLGLPERGVDNIKLISNCTRKTHVATGYKRIVFGDHGPYFEFDDSQVIFKHFNGQRRKVHTHSTTKGTQKTGT